MAPSGIQISVISNRNSETAGAPFPITDFRLLKLVGLGRFELPTSRLSSARSNQLSYKPGSEASNQKSVIRRNRHLITDYRSPAPDQLVREEREMKTAASRQ